MSGDPDFQIFPKFKYLKYVRIFMIYWMNYPCKLCDHKATSKGHLIQHKRTVHEGLKYSCEQCVYKATSKDNLAQHKRAVHEGLKYPCELCDHKATSKENFA